MFVPRANAEDSSHLVFSVTTFQIRNFECSFIFFLSFPLTLNVIESIDSHHDDDKTSVKQILVLQCFFASGALRLLTWV